MQTFPVSVWIAILAAVVLSMAVVLTIESSKLSPTARMVLSGLALMAILYAGVFAAAYVLARETLPAEKAEVK